LTPQHQGSADVICRAEGLLIANQSIRPCAGLGPFCPWKLRPLNGLQPLSGYVPRAVNLPPTTVRRFLWQGRKFASRVAWLAMCQPPANVESLARSGTGKAIRDGFCACGCPALHRARH
jgi:hypothetical protein